MASLARNSLDSSVALRLAAPTLRAYGRHDLSRSLRTGATAVSNPTHVGGRGAERRVTRLQRPAGDPVEERDHGGEGQADDVGVIAPDPLHEHRRPPLDGVPASFSDALPE